MSRKKLKNHKFHEGNRTPITSSNYLSKVKLLLALYAVTTLVTLAFLIIYFGVTYGTLIITASAIVCSGLIIRYIVKNTRSTCVKGENLLLSTMDNSNIVAPIRSIKKVRSFPLFGMYITNICYKLDGRRSSFFFVSKKLENKSPETFIRRSITLANEKKKANHKPGSVITQQIA